MGIAAANNQHTVLSLPVSRMLLDGIIVPAVCAFNDQAMFVNNELGVGAAALAKRMGRYCDAACPVN